MSPLNENKELSVKSYTPTGHPPHIGPSANIAPTDIEKQAASFPDTGLLASLHPDTGYPTTSQLPTFSANTGGLITSQPFVFTTNNLAAPKIGAGASTPFMSLPQVPLTPHPRDAPAVTTSLRPVHPSAFDLGPCADPFTPECSPATLYREIKPTPYVQGQNRTPPNSDSVSQIAEAMAKVTQLQRLPQAKPDVFTGNETDTKFFTWETAFDALIDSAPISAQQKQYLLYQHLDGKAKKVVEQLQYIVSATPEIAYSEARKKLKSRFGRPAIIATNFENKLVNWPKIGSNDAQGLREFSDFLQQVEIAESHLDSLTIFEYPSKLQTLVEKLPSWFLTKWSTTVQTLQQRKGCDAFPTFAEFVEEVTFHADRMNIPQIFRHATKDPNPPAPCHVKSYPVLLTWPRKQAANAKSHPPNQGRRNQKAILLLSSVSFIKPNLTR